MSVHNENNMDLRERFERKYYKKVQAMRNRKKSRMIRQYLSKATGLKSYGKIQTSF